MRKFTIGETIPQQVNVEAFRQLLYTAPSSERVRWWRAFPNPAYNPKTASVNTAAGNDKYTFVEQIAEREYRAVFNGEKIEKRFLQQGEFQAGMITVTTMPDELPLAENDMISPIGQNSYGVGESVDFRTFTYKQVIPRGSSLFRRSGTVNSSGAAVTGSGTTFLTDARVGDVFNAANQSGIVASVNSNTSLTLVAAPTTAFAGNAYAVGREVLLWDTAVSLIDVRDSSTVYMANADVRVSADGTSLAWKTGANSTAIGGNVSVTYSYGPKYEILPDMGMHRHVVGGVGLPQTVVARLMQNESFKRG